MATPTVQVNIRMPAELHDELTTFAASDERSLTAVIVRAIRDHLKSNGPAASPVQGRRDEAATKVSVTK